MYKDKDKNKGRVVEFKTLEAVHCDPSPQHAKKLSQYVRQMAVSQTVLRETHSGSFLVMIGRDHRVLVLEDTGTHEAFDWLKNDFNYWFRSSQPHAAFLKQFLGVVAPYTQECERRKQRWDRFLLQRQEKTLSKGQRSRRNKHLHQQQRGQEFAKIKRASVDDKAPQPPEMKREEADFSSWQCFCEMI